MKKKSSSAVVVTMSQQWTSNRQQRDTAPKELSPDRHQEQRRGQKLRPLSSAGELTSHKESTGSKVAIRPVPMMSTPMPMMSTPMPMMSTPMPMMSTPMPMMSTPMPMPPLMPNLIRFPPPVAPVFFPSAAPVPFQYVERCPTQSFAEQEETNYQETCYPNSSYISAESYQPSRSLMSLTSGNMQPLKATNSCSNFHPSGCSNSFPPTYGWFQGGAIEPSSQFWNEPVGVDCSAFGQQQNPGAPNSYDFVQTLTPLEVPQLRPNVAASQAATKLNPRGIKTFSFQCVCPKAPEKESVACQVERAVKDASTNTDSPPQVISSGTNTEQPEVKVAETNTEISIPGVLLEWPPYIKHSPTQAKLVKLTETRMSTPPSLDEFQDRENDLEPALSLEQTISAFQERRKETAQQELKHDTFNTSKDELKRIPVPQHPISLKKLQALSFERLPHGQHLNKSKNCISAESDFDEIYYSDDGDDDDDDDDDDGLSLSDEENVPATVSDSTRTLVQVSKCSDIADLSSVLPGRLKSEPSTKFPVSSEAGFLPVRSCSSKELPQRSNNFPPQPFSGSNCPVSSHAGARFSMPELPCLSSVAHGQPYQARFPGCLADASFVSSVLAENSSLTNQILSMLLKVNPLFALNPVAHQQAAFTELLLVKRYQTEMKLFEERKRANLEQERLVERGQNMQKNIRPPVFPESDCFKFYNTPLSPARRQQESVHAMKQEHRFRSLSLNEPDENLPLIKNSQQELQQDDKAQKQRSCILVNDNLTEIQKHSTWGESSKRKQPKQPEDECDLIGCRSLQHDSWISVKSGGWQRWKKMNSSKTSHLSSEESHVELDDWDDKPQGEDERPGRYILEEKVSELSLITLDDSSKDAEITLAKKESNPEMADAASEKDNWQQVCRRKQKREGRPNLKDKSSKKTMKWKKMSGC